MITVAEVCDWYLAEAEAGRILGRRNRPIKPSTLAMDRSRIETHVEPLIGRRQVRAFKLADIAGMQADIAGGKTAKPRAAGRGGVATGGAGGAGVAARTVSTLQSLLAHAKLLNMITSNPAVGMRKLAGKKKERRLSVAEIKRLGEAMRAAGWRASGRARGHTTHAFDGLSDLGSSGPPTTGCTPTRATANCPTPRATGRCARSGLRRPGSRQASRSGTSARMSSPARWATATIQLRRDVLHASARRRRLRMSHPICFVIRSAASPAISVSLN